MRHVRFKSVGLAWLDEHIKKLAERFNDLIHVLSSGDVEVDTPSHQPMTILRSVARHDFSVELIFTVEASIPSGYYFGNPSLDASLRELQIDKQPDVFSNPIQRFRMALWATPAFPLHGCVWSSLCPFELPMLPVDRFEFLISMN